ncbi:hypothetical protein OY14_01580 [Borreliella chilensis]|uniref:Uncharacterized protein n=1 Tax=Borreliella chilensis TaxID=1245910 RepID=A0A0A7V1R5_9SPIR|nr:hypothetical protein OY14_01580 [Borreliella chilensis]
MINFLKIHQRYWGINVFGFIICFKLLILSAIKNMNNFQILLHHLMKFKICIQNLFNVLLNLGYEFFAKNPIIRIKCDLQIFG